jgi:hypothetical protein
MLRHARQPWRPVFAFAHLVQAVFSCPKKPLPVSDRRVRNAPE